MEVLIFLAILFVGFMAMVYLFLEMVFPSPYSRPSLGGFLRMLLAMVGLGFLFGGDDGDGCA
jgi:hypothetical protein